MNTDASTTTKQTATAASQGASVATAMPTATKKATTKTGAPKAKQGAKKAARKAAARKKGAMVSVPREFSKKAIVLDLLRRKNGATMAEITKATHWQNHSVRGFISGTVSKRMGLKVESSKNEAGERMYRIASK
jgi:hypothetical protein